MGSQLLAESLGRDPRFEISGVVAAGEILSMAGSIQADVAVISLDSDGPKRKGLQVARTLSARHYPSAKGAPHAPAPRGLPGRSPSGPRPNG